MDVKEQSRKDGIEKETISRPLGREGKFCSVGDKRKCSLDATRYVMQFFSFFSSAIWENCFRFLCDFQFQKSFVATCAISIYIKTSLWLKEFLCSFQGLGHRQDRRCECQELAAVWRWALTCEKLIFGALTNLCTMQTASLCTFSRRWLRARSSPKSSTQPTRMSSTCQDTSCRKTS